MRVRKATAAGQFYAGTPGELRQQIEWCYQHQLGPGAVPQVNEKGPRKILAIIVPHAGYPYSGPVAAHAYKALAEDGIFDSAVMLGPNHTGYGPGVSLWPKGKWNTPLGDAEVDERLVQRLLGERVFKADEMAHMYEHSIEVQLPWLQYLYSKVKFVPITMLTQDLETAKTVGRAIAQIGENDIIIATTDFTHYEPHQSAVEKDELVIKAITELDEEELFRQRAVLSCSMCGYGPVAAAIVAAKERGAKEVTILKYATSGDTTGDFSAVVGYASIVMRR
jgi:hypothetical protein